MLILSSLRRRKKKNLTFSFPVSAFLHRFLTPHSCSLKKEERRAKLLSFYFSNLLFDLLVFLHRSNSCFFLKTKKCCFFCVTSFAFSGGGQLHVGLCLILSPLFRPSLFTPLVRRALLSTSGDLTAVTLFLFSLTIFLFERIHRDVCVRGSAGSIAGCGLA